MVNTCCMPGCKSYYKSMKHLHKYCYNTCNSGVLKFLTQSDHYPIFTIRKDEESPIAKSYIMKINHSYKNIANF